MARFRLKGKHYLNVLGSEWEQKETDSRTGKQIRRVYPVPMFLDPDDPADYNYPGDGIIVATAEDKRYPRDHIFTGKPTPDMEPMDEEAEALIEANKKNWINPIESLSGTYGDNLRVDFERQIAELQAATGGNVMQTLKAMQDQITALQKQLAEKTGSPATTPAARRA